MTNFDYAFTLIGLILGLAVVEVLSGLVRTLRLHNLREIGWLTPLLGVVVICDLITFWGLIGGFRQIMPSLYKALAAGVLITSLYYLAAGMVFPAKDADLNAHYFRYRRKIFALIIACNLPIFAYQIRFWELDSYLVNGGWLLLTMVALAVSSVRLSYLAMACLVALYVYMFVMS